MTIRRKENGTRATVRERERACTVFCFTTKVEWQDGKQRKLKNKRIQRWYDTTESFDSARQQIRVYYRI